MAGSDLTQHLLLATGVIVLAAHLGGLIARRLGQPPVLGQIAAGIVLGPSVLGALWPAASTRLLPAEIVPHLQPLADIGLVLFMFLVGLELDHDLLRGQGHRAVVVSHASIVVPFGTGALLGSAIHDRVAPGVDPLPFALFVGAAMAITAFPVLARILQETGLTRTRVGTLALACAAVDDVTAWCILAAVLAVADDSGGGSAVATVAAAIAFGALMWFVVRPLLRRFGEVPAAVAVALALTSAFVTDWIGIHAIFGAFLAGLILPRRPADSLLLQERLDAVVSVLLLPIFFMVVGLSTHIGLVDTPALWAVTGLVLVVALAGKLGGAAVAARVMGESWRDAWTIGILMNTRGLTEIVILSVGLERGILTERMFTIMVIMALVTTFMAVPVLRRVADLPEGQGITRSRARGRSGSAPASG